MYCMIRITNIRMILRHATCVVWLICMPVCLLAEGVDYPCRYLVDTERYGVAYAELQKMEAKSPDDHAVAFAYYKLCVTRDNPDRDLRKAYTWLCRSQDRLKAYPQKDQAKAEKNGYTEQLYATEYSNVCLFAQLEAQRHNTLEAWNDYLNTYTRAPQKLMAQVTKTRDALAFSQAEKTNSVEAYRQFVESYPKAQERTEAEKRIYALAYNDLVAGGTEKECAEYIMLYPKSPYIDKVRDQAAGLEMKRLVNKRDWQSQKDYLISHATANRWRDTVIVYMVRYVLRTRNMDAARWGIGNLPHPHSDSCWMTMRTICMEDTTLLPLAKFYKNYTPQADAALIAADKRLIEADEQFRNGLLSPEQYIRQVAPAYPAYYQLQKLIKPHVKAKQWDAVLNTVKTYRQAFGGDYRYSDLLRLLQEPLDTKLTATSVGAGVNTPDGNEFLPVLATNGTQLYFCGTKRSGNIGKEDIFYSQMTPKGWSKAEPVTELNTADANEAPLSLTADGTTMIVFLNGKLMLSHRTKSGWGPLRPLSRNLNIGEWLADAMITSDGKALLFAALSKSHHEQQMSINIFVSLLQENGEWGKPFGLGPAINTTRIDRSPFLHPDMRTLYFCSEGHGSMGGTDVFVSTRLNERSWTEWSTPVNMGKTINTSGNECWYKISTDGAEAYFSKRENKQNDICQLAIPEHLRPEPVTTLSGKVTDTHGDPVMTLIQWEDLETQRLAGHTLTDPEDGSFFIVLPEGKNYGYYIFNDKLFPVSGNIDLRNVHEFQTVESDITVASIKQMIEEEVSMPMNNLFFNTGEYILLPASVAELNRVAAIIRQVGKRVEISGHTDSVGDDESNRILSENRAIAVRNHLIKLGIQRELLTTKGYGESKPVANNNTAAGRQKNRRVELKFIK